MATTAASRPTPSSRPQGQLYELRCAPQPVLGTDFRRSRLPAASPPARRRSCSTRGKGQARGAHLASSAASARRTRLLWDSGSVRERPGDDRQRRSREAASTPTARCAASCNGWRPATARPGRIVTLDREFHETGKLVHERRWRAAERGGEPVSESALVPQRPAEATETQYVDRRRQHAAPARSRSTTTARRPFEGSVAGRCAWRPRRRARDRHAPELRTPKAGCAPSASTTSAAASRASASSTSAATVVRDDEVFEDGSRKAVRPMSDAAPKRSTT